MANETTGVKKSARAKNFFGKDLKESGDYIKIFYNLFNGTPNPLLVTDRFGNFIDANPCFLNLFRIPERDIIKKNIRDIKTENSNLHDEFQEFLNTGSQSGSTTVIISESPHSVEYKTYRLAKNRFLISFIDNTESLNLKKEIKKKDIIFNSLLKNIQHGIAVLDKDFNRVYVNDTFNNFENIISSGNIKNFNKIYKSLAERTFNSAEKYEERISVVSDNKSYNFLLNSSPVSDENNNLTNVIITVEDITKIVHSNIEIESAVTLLNTLLDSLPVAVFYKDKNGIYKGCNKLFEYMSGKTKDEIIGRKASDIFATKDALLYDELDSEVLKYGGIRKFRHKRMHHGKNEISNFVITKTAYYDILEKTNGVIGIVEDLTDIETAQWEFENAKKYAENLTNEANILIIGFTKEGKIIEFNKKAELISGFSKDEILGTNISDIPLFISETDFRNSDFYKVLNNEIPEHFEFEQNIITKSGTQRIILWNTCKLPVGRTSEGFFFFGIDNTELKITTSKLREIMHAVEQSNESIILTDPDGRIKYVNKAFTNLTGYTSAEVIGKNPRLLKSGNTPKVVYEDLWDTVLSGNTWSGEMQNKKKNGELYWEFASITPVMNENRKIESIIALKTDITALKESRDEILKVNEKINELNSLKASLLANITHEFRTPLIGIIGFADILKNEITNSWHLDMVTDIYNQSKRLLNTLSLVIRLSQLESKELKPEYREVNVIDIIKGVLPQFFKRIEEKNLKLIFEEPASAINCITDLMMLKEIVSNIIDNAVKFTDSGNITVEVGEVTENKIKYVSVKITDTGIGIHKDRQELIYQEFKQVSAGMDKKYGGAGLGLTITKYLVELLNGKITLESSPGLGSAFTVLIPVFNSDGNISIKSHTSQVKDNEEELYSNVLIIEDSLSNISVMENYLSGICNVESVYNGEEALKLAGKKNFDIVLMDINLGSGIDGIATMKMLKRYKDLSEVPFIAVTGYAMLKDKEHILSEGFNDFLAKPFSKKEFLNLILKYLPNER